MELEPFQRRFLRGMATEPISCFSAPRGNGKSFLAGMAAADALRAANAGEEIAVVAGSVNQGRIVFRYVRSFLGETDFRYIDSAQRCTVTRTRDGAKLSVMAASGRTAMGIVRVPLVIADEPAAWRQNDGELLADALLTAVGKPDSPLRVIFCGTLAPLGVPGHWWHEMIAAGSRPGYFVQLLQGRADRWDDLREIYRVNPLSRVSADFRETLRRERDEARGDTRLKARFLSYRLNLPTADEASMLLPLEDWQAVLARPVGERSGRPVFGVDLGGGRAWSAIVALWPNGRCEAVALTGGEPSLEEQEKRDRVAGGTYRRLAEGGALMVDAGLRVPRPRVLWEAALRRWGVPAMVVCDRFRLPELRDAVGTAAPVEPRMTRWSESSADIRALRKLATDGGMTAGEASRDLLSASLALAVVQSDDAGNHRLVKRGTNNTARDDVAAALILAAGALERIGRRPRFRVLRSALAG